MIYGFKIALFLYIRFGKPIRKKGGMDKVNINKIRHNLGLTAFIRKEGVEMKAKSIIAQFFKDKRTKNEIVEKGR